LVSRRFFVILRIHVRIFLQCEGGRPGGAVCASHGILPRGPGLALFGAVLISVKVSRASLIAMKRAGVVFLVVVLFIVLSIGILPNVYRPTPNLTHLQVDGAEIDPSGVHSFYNMTYVQNANGTTTLTYYMNLTSYEQMLHDTYSSPPQGVAQVFGNMVMIIWTYVPPNISYAGPVQSTSVAPP